MAITPYPSHFVLAGILPVGEKGLEKVQEVCRFLSEDLAECVNAWQIANEMMFPTFRAPLSDEEACLFIIRSIRGMRNNSHKTDPYCFGNGLAQCRRSVHNLDLTGG